jgi:osmotically-inducible protein OsmY
MRPLRVLVLALTALAGCASSPIDPAARGADADQRLVNLIELRLSSDGRLCPYDIDVTSVNRTVRLEGRVDSPAERRRAEQIAVGAGATRVIDSIMIDLGSGDRGRC